MAEHTKGPWVQFADQGKCIAIMPAGREGDICTFQQSPTDADAHLMTIAPAFLDALKLIEYASRKDSLTEVERLQSVRTVVCATLSRYGFLVGGSSK